MSAFDTTLTPFEPIEDGYSPFQPNASDALSPDNAVVADRYREWVLITAPRRLDWFRFRVRPVQDNESADDQETLTGSLVGGILDDWLALQNSGLSEHARNRIERLVRKPDGWKGPGSSKLRSESLRHFLKFWGSIKSKAQEPFIALAPNGNLYAEWHTSWKRHLDVEFNDDGLVYFGLFKGREIIEGKTKLNNFISSMGGRSDKPFQWKR